MDLLERFITSQERIAAALEKLLTGAALAIPPEDAPKATRAPRAPKDPPASAPPVARGVDPTVLPSQPAVAIEELRASVMALAGFSAAGKAEMININSKFGVKKASDAPAEKWGEIKAAVDAALTTLKESENFA